MSTYKLRRPTAGLNLELEQLSLLDDVQEPEKAVKAGGLPAMLRSLRKKAATMKTENSIGDDKGSENRSTPVPLEIDSSDEVDNNENRLQKYLVASDLEKNIIRQVEHYFGDYNLPKDRFMHEQMDDEGWISMDVMLTFKRLSQLTLDADVIMEALFKSMRKIVEVDVVRRRIRRHPDSPLLRDDEATRLEIDERTVFVSGFHRESTTLDALLDFFDNGGFGNVCHVRMRYRRSPQEGQVLDGGDSENNRKFLGSIFVIFDSIQSARDFIKRVATGNIRFAGRRLNAKTKKEFLDQRIENNDDFCPLKVSRTVYVHGFDKIDLSDQEVANFFANFDGAESVKKRVYRDNNSHEAGEGEWKFNGSVFVFFNSERAVEAFIKQHRKNPITYRGDRLKVKTQLEYYEQMGKFQRRIREFKGL